METIFKNISIGDERYFFVDGGERIRKQDINKAIGKIPVYSGSKVECGTIGFVSDTIKDIVPNAKKFNGKFLTVNANGSVGKVFLREGEFYLHDDVNIVKILDENILPEYLLYELQNKIDLLGYGSWTKKLYKNELKQEVYVEIPIDGNGNFSTEQQKEIARKYEKIDQIKKKLREDYNKINSYNVLIDESYEIKPIALLDLFSLKKGDSKYTKKFVNSNRGEFPVYSASTKNNGIFGYVNCFDYNEECLQITTNGVYAGTVFHRKEHGFSINGDAKLLIKKNKNISYDYFIYELSDVLSRAGFNWENKVSDAKLAEIVVNIPIDTNGNYDLKKQESIAQLHKKISAIKSKIQQSYQKILDSKVQIIIA